MTFPATTRSLARRISLQHRFRRTVHRYGPAWVKKRRIQFRSLNALALCDVSFSVTKMQDISKIKLRRERVSLEQHPIRRDIHEPVRPLTSCRRYTR